MAESDWDFRKPSLRAESKNSVLLPPFVARMRRVWIKTTAVGRKKWQRK
jgi:hypothetical protein